MGRLSRLAAALGLLVGTFAVPAAAVAVDVEFGTPTATATFGQSITFVQPVTVRDAAGAEILLTFPGSLGPLATPKSPPPNGTSTLTHTLLLADGHLQPNTRITARWRVSFDDGSTETGPAVAITYADDRFEWQSARGDLMTVHWFEGSAAFGRRALRIGEDAIAKAEDLLGVKETEPIDFFVYADKEAFYDALGPGTRENVGGQANADLRTLYALITPGEIDDAWVGIVIPHELTHLVFDTAVANPYNFPPRWLNEGVATYLSQGYDAADRRTVEQAASDGTLIPLDGLTGQFPTTRDGFYQAYAQSVSAVDYLVATHGQEALVSLINSYAKGRTDDEAFSDALGLDAAGFDAAWFASLGATLPDRVGPRPDPAGPLPSAWTGAAPTPTSGSSATPGATASAPPSPGAGEGGGGEGQPIVPIAVGGLAVLAVVLIVAALAMRRNRSAAVTSTRRSGIPGSDTPGTDTAGADAAVLDVPGGPAAIPGPTGAAWPPSSTPPVDTPPQVEASHDPDP